MLANELVPILNSLERKINEGEVEPDFLFALRNTLKEVEKRLQGVDGLVELLAKKKLVVLPNPPTIENILTEVITL